MRAGHHEKACNIATARAAGDFTGRMTSKQQCQNTKGKHRWTTIILISSTMVFVEPHRPTRPSHLSVGKCSEWVTAIVGKKRVLRNSKPFMVAKLSLILARSRFTKRKGVSAQATDLRLHETFSSISLSKYQCHRIPWKQWIQWHWYFKKL